MHIKKIVRQHRRDFIAIYACEHCDHEYEFPGYDDSFFHNNVIPKMECKKCGKIAGDNSKAMTPKYHEGQVV